MFFSLIQKIINRNEVLDSCCCFPLPVVGKLLCLLPLSGVFYPLFSRTASQHSFVTAQWVFAHIMHSGKRRSGRMPAYMLAGGKLRLVNVWMSARPALDCSLTEVRTVPGNTHWQFSIPKHAVACCPLPQGPPVTGRWTVLGCFILFSPRSKQQIWIRTKTFLRSLLGPAGLDQSQTHHASPQEWWNGLLSLRDTSAPRRAHRWWWPLLRSVRNRFGILSCTSINLCVLSEEHILTLHPGKGLQN